MKKYYSLILFAVFVLLAGVILLVRDSSDVSTEITQPPVNTNELTPDPVDEGAQEQVGEVIEAAPEYVDLENVQVDFEQDLVETDDIMDDYSEFDQDIEVDSIDEAVL